MTRALHLDPCRTAGYPERSDRVGEGSAKWDAKKMPGSNVLVVDDNLELAENVCEMLEQLPGYQLHCSHAPDARTALAMAAATGSDLDLALVDLRLPDEDGIALIPKLRRHCPQAHFILMTGHATVETAAAAVAGGVVGFVLKPFQSTEFLLTTRRALDQVLARRERERLLEQLEQSERRHREVVEGIPALVLGLDANDAIVVFNRQLEAVSGFKRDEMLGRKGRDLIGERGGDRRLQTKAGEARIIRWQCADISTASGKTTYAMGIDVTDEREMTRRTVRAERLAAVGTLAAGLAHEVRNPLNSANLQLQVLKRRLAKGQPEGVAQSADLVAGEIERLDRLVSDFLAFARPQPLALSAVDPNQFVKGVHAQLQPEAEAKGVTLRFAGAPHVETADIEEERMRQVLLNLARNAMEAVGQGGAVALRTRAADARGNVAIEVVDDGPGFPEDAPIFDAFYTTKEHGTGLGLAIAHRIVTDHGGTLSVASRPGHTCFSVLLPQRTRHASDRP